MVYCLYPNVYLLPDTAKDATVSIAVLMIAVNF